MDLEKEASNDQAMNDPGQQPRGDPGTGESGAALGGGDCLHFYYDEERRLPCLPGCQANAGGIPKCIKLVHDPSCWYPLSRAPEEPAMMPKPVRWCPGPGGCQHFDSKDYSCALKMSGKPFEFTYKYARLERTALSFSFSGRGVMVVGAMYFLASAVFLMTRAGGELLGAINTLFAALVLIGGYFLHQWETKPWGGRWHQAGKSASKRDSFAVGTVKSEVLAMAPAPTLSPVQGVNPASATPGCPVFYQAQTGDLPCLPDCGFWSRSRAKCVLHDPTFSCPYPKSRQPLVRSLMSPAVTWCCGPGGCLHFDYSDYSCALKRAREPMEFRYRFDLERRNRRLAVVIMAFGMLAGLTIFYTSFPNNRWGMALGVVIGGFLVRVGHLIWAAAR